MEAIVAQDIVRVHKTGRGIDSLTFSIPPGQCIGILGPNGSGKTTLTRLVAGLDRIQHGRLLVLGELANPRSRHLRRCCGVALEMPAHWDALTGRQNLCFFGRQYGLSGSDLNERMQTLLSEAGLDAQADDPVDTYSFGMRRKLGIIEAIISDPELLVLDEPSAGADSDFLERLFVWVRSRCERGLTTWLADNDADWLARAATHLILLADGKIRIQGDVRELTASIAPRQRIELILEQPCSDVFAPPTIAEVYSYHCEDRRIMAEVSGNGDISVELIKWINSCGGRVRSMNVRSVTLYEALTQREAES